MKKLLTLLCCITLVGCANYSKIKSPRYFDNGVEILNYKANPYNTEWILRAEPSETMELVFNYETINIDFKLDPERPGEYIFTIKSKIHE